MIGVRRQGHSKPARRGRWLRLLSLAGAATLFATAPVVAADDLPRDIGGWTLAQSGDGGGCFLSRQYDGVGHTTLLLGLDKDGSNRLSLLNDNWSISPKARVKLDFRLSGGGYVKHDAVGLASNGQKGFVTTFDAKFPTYFATSTALQVSRGDVPVEQIDLAGSGAAVAALRRCVDAVKAGPKAETGKTSRSDAIPKDPFASDHKRRTKP